MNRWIVALATCLLLVAGAFALAPRVQAPPAAAEGWRAFTATWSVTGQQQMLPTEGGRAAATAQLSGAVVLATGDGLSRGFRGDYIGFDDGRALTVGRWVWTDEHGNQIFGEMRGEPVQTGRRSAATITGGSGRYAGVSGTYQFHWQYVVEAEDGTIQGRTTGLEGRYRFGGGQP